MKYGLQYHFLQSFKDYVTPAEADLYGHINWSLTQAQKQSSLGLSQSSTSMRGGRTRPRVGFQFSVQKRHVGGSSGASITKKPGSDIRTEGHQNGWKSCGGGASASFTDSTKKGSHGR